MVGVGNFMLMQNVCNIELKKVQKINPSYVCKIWGIIGKCYPNCTNCKFEFIQLRQDTAKWHSIMLPQKGCSLAVFLILVVAVVVF